MLLADRDSTCAAFFPCHEAVGVSVRRGTYGGTVDEDDDEEWIITFRFPSFVFFGIFFRKHVKTSFSTSDQGNVRRWLIDRASQEGRMAESIEKREEEELRRKMLFCICSFFFSLFPSFSFFFFFFPFFFWLHSLAGQCPDRLRRARRRKRKRRKKRKNLSSKLNANRWKGMFSVSHR